MSAGKSALGALLFAFPLLAHVGTSDVFFRGSAGPYALLVTIRPPEVIPGVAAIEVRALSPDVRAVELTPTPMTGAAANHPPVADAAQRSSADPSYYEGSLWLMSPGSWKVHVRVTGSKGSGELLVPVPAIPLRTRHMQKEVGYFLFGMMVFLTVGMIAIVGAAVRESELAPAAGKPVWTRKAILWMIFTAGLLVAALWFGKSWWADDARTFARRDYKPLEASGRLDGANHFELRLRDPGWLPMRRLDDLEPDHGHLTHLFLIRWPAMDEAFHLHPDQTATGNFETTLPSLPAGRYRIYADIVHADGLAETAVGELDLPDVKGAPLTGDDAGGNVSAPPGNGFRMVLRSPLAPVKAKQANLFTFAILRPDGSPANDLEPYMGMGGHAEFLKRDGSVFAHVHPTGSVPMASVAVASEDAMMAMHEAHVGPEVSFPYGLPSAGRYRVFVQMKRAGKVETGAFDITVQ